MIRRGVGKCCFLDYVMVIALMTSSQTFQLVSDLRKVKTDTFPEGASKTLLITERLLEFTGDGGREIILLWRRSHL